ncbi:MAG: carbohydrate-binding domain-containing protein, partial [Oscillospiraceae bacterium]|nr:carbohydrate-binding domain-containing protein [Oscillospiraceae bacterium]
MKWKKMVAPLLAAAITVSGIPAASVVSFAADASGVSGDVSGDGTFSAADAVLMQKWLLSVPGTELKNPQAGDMNKDGKIDARDLFLLKQQLLSPPSEAANGSVITFAGGAVTVSDENGNKAANHPAIQINGQTVTITQPGEYTVSGSSENGQLIVDVDKNAPADEKVTLNLNGLTLSHPSLAPIYIANGGDSCVISVKKDTVNTISDGSSHTDSYTTNEGETKQIKAAIFARDDLKIKGKGTLIVNGNTADGIACTDDLKLYNGTITVKAADDGIRGKDSVVIGDPEDTDFSTLKLTVNAKNGDGIKSTNTANDQKGRIEINGGTVSVDAHSDGLQATRAVT